MVLKRGISKLSLNYKFARSSTSIRSVTQKECSFRRSKVFHKHIKKIKLFDSAKYQKHLTTSWLGQSFEYVKEIGSTNSYLKKRAPENISHGQVLLAGLQTKGRGQYKRNWESAAGQNLTFTLVLRPQQANRFHILTLACARALVAQIEEELNQPAALKWPNDVIADGKKIAGLLTETVFNGNKLDRLLIGIGININQTSFADEIKAKAGSLRMACGAEIDREHFLAELLSRIEFEYGRWHKQNDELLKWINQKIIGYGQWVRLKVDGQKHPGAFKMVGIDNSGRLAVIDKEGGVKTFSYEQIRIIVD